MYFNIKNIGSRLDLVKAAGRVEFSPPLRGELGGVDKTVVGIVWIFLLYYNQWLSMKKS